MTTDLTSEAWSALGDATRRTIFELVASEPLSVGEISAQVPVSRPAVSQHLKVLANAGLVVQRQQGTRRYYSANPEGLAGLRECVEEFWQQALGSFAAMMEEKT